MLTRGDLFTTKSCVPSGGIIEDIHTTPIGHGFHYCCLNRAQALVYIMAGPHRARNAQWTPPSVCDLAPFRGQTVVCRAVLCSTPACVVCLLCVYCLRERSAYCNEELHCCALCERVRMKNSLCRSAYRQAQRGYLPESSFALSQLPKRTCRDVSKRLGWG